MLGWRFMLVRTPVTRSRKSHSNLVETQSIFMLVMQLFNVGSFHEIKLTWFIFAVVICFVVMVPECAPQPKSFLYKTDILVTQDLNLRESVRLWQLLS